MGGEVTFSNCSIYENTADDVRALPFPRTFFQCPVGRNFQEVALPEVLLCMLCQVGGLYIEGDKVALDNCNIYENEAYAVRVQPFP